ncbi:MAG: hypothetical protein D6769_02320 [Methanobacteriota archaeon]|nr:MAG: hypothetical protein D6769_02320 [Euryarchaeota archaeon]
MDAKWYIAIIIVTIVLVGAFFYMSKGLAGEHAGEEKVMEKQAFSIVDALSKMEAPQNYIAVKEEKIDSPLINLSRRIEVRKNNGDLYVKIEDKKNFLTAEYIKKGNETWLCFNFTERVCGNPSTIPAYAISLPQEDFSAFINNYKKQMEFLEKNGAFKALKKEEGKNCTTYNYTYSFGDVPLKELRKANINVKSSYLDIVYNSSICLDNKVVWSFEKVFNDVNGINRQGVKLVEFKEENNLTIPDGGEKNDTLLKAHYDNYANFLEEVAKAKDPQLRSIATQYHLPDICYRAEDSDTCFAIYVDQFNDSSVCPKIENSSLREKCIQATGG